MRYITGLEIDELCADFSSFVEGRRLEDDGNLLLRYKGGARGVLYASQVSAGEENNLSPRRGGMRDLEVETAGLEISGDTEYGSYESPGQCA